jgi:hypothetical protein
LFSYTFASAESKAFTRTRERAFYARASWGAAVLRPYKIAMTYKIAVHYKIVVIGFFWAWFSTRGA